MIKKTKKNANAMRSFHFLLVLTAAILLSSCWMPQANADMIETAVPVGSDIVRRVTVSEATNKIYVASGDSDSNSRVTVIDGTDYTTTSLTVARSPRGMTADEINNKIYVANSGGGCVSIIDGVTNAVSVMPDYFYQPVDVAYDSGTQLLYVLEYYNSDMAKGAVKILSGGTVTDTVFIDPYPLAMALNDATHKIYVIYESGNVQVIDTASANFVTTINTPGSISESIAVDSLTNQIYVTNGGSHNVTVIDGSDNSVTASISLGGGNPMPWGITVNESTKKIYVANQGGSVSVIDGATHTVIQTLAIPNNASPVGIAADSARNKIFIISINTNNVTIIDGSIIEAAEVSGLTAPAAGETPQTAGLTAGDGRYSVSSLSWENLGGGSASLDDGKFTNAANTYQARIQLTAAAGYKFPAGGPALTVNTGSPADMTVDTDNPGNKLTFVVTFPAVIAADDVSVLNLEAPAAGETPAAPSAISSGNPDQYTVSALTWEYTGGSPMDSAKFLYGGSWYQARIVLTSQPGYKFPTGGLTPDVAGDGTASPGAFAGGDVSGNTLTFVTTFSEEIGHIYIEGLNPPAAGETPQDMHDLTAGYCCNVSNLTWKNSDGTPATLTDGKFISGGPAYRAVIELTSREGCKFPPGGGLEPEFSGDGIFESGNISGGNASGNKFTFTVTFSNEITWAEVGGLAAPATGEVPVGYDALTAGSGAQYYVDGIEWLDSDYGEATLTDGKFNAASSYIAVIYLRANAGYRFPEGLTPAVNDGTSSAGFIDEPVSGNMLIFIITFPPTPVGGQGVAPVITTTALPGGTLGAEYAYSLAATGDGPVTWILSGGSLPEGIDLESDGDLSGTALTTGIFDFTVMATNSAGQDTQALSIVISAVPPVTAYTVTFNSNGSVYTAKTVNSGDSIGAAAWPSNPARSGYTFGGWFTGKDGAGNTFTSSTTVNAGITVYAKWTGQINNDNGGSTGAGSSPAAKTPGGFIPVGDLTTSGLAKTFDVESNIAKVTVPSNMLSGVAGISGANAKIVVKAGEKNALSDDMKNKIGDRPLISLTLEIDGVQVDWSNPSAPVTISIPYAPTEAELLNPESIVVWYIDGSGNVAAIPNGRYDAATGRVTFNATHFSGYAVVYNKVSFNDVASGAWYNKAVSFIAARTITGGTGNGNYSPYAKLSRGEFIVLMMRACGIEADTNPTDNFSDAGNTYYTGCLAAAKRLGITNGIGNNLYGPGNPISRQEMFTLLYNALKIIGRLPQGDSGKTLSDFSDAGMIDPWAQESMAFLVKTGTVGGSYGKLTPKDTATRAEMAQVLYNLLAK